MKPPAFPHGSSRLTNLVAAGLVMLPALASAHPGHYHPPGEEDEFDALRASFLHLHGSLEIGIAFAAMASVIVFRLARNLPLRLASAIAFGGSLAFLAAH